MTIEHIVIAGGGPSGLMTIGALYELEKQAFWDIKNIKTITGTSAGALVGLMVASGLEMETIKDYIVKRPWDKAFENGTSDLLDIFQYGGVDAVVLSRIIFKPILSSIDLAEDATLMQMYEKTGITMKLITVDLNASNVLSQVVLSHTTFPDLPVHTAAAMSAAAPLAFRPVIYNGGCYSDGGLVNNYPLDICAESVEDRDTILGFPNIWSSSDTSITQENITGVTYLHTLLLKIHRMIERSALIDESIENEVACDASELTGMNVWLEACSSSTTRDEVTEKGCKMAQTFLERRREKLLQSV